MSSGGDSEARLGQSQSAAGVIAPESDSFAHRHEGLTFSPTPRVVSAAPPRPGMTPSRSCMHHGLQLAMRARQLITVP